VHLTVPLALSYPVSFIPKRCRKPTTEYFLAEAFADLRAVDSTDAEVAFRVQTSGNFSQAEGTFTILSYNNQLWWPLRLFNRQEGTFPLATADTLLNEMESGRENFLRLRPMWLAPRKIETAAIREIVSNDYEAALAGAQRKIADYLLLCGGAPYVADGDAPGATQRGRRALFSFGETRPPRAFRRRRQSDRHGSQVGYHQVLPRSRRRAATGLCTAGIGIGEANFRENLGRIHQDA
jgi:hypothetical protein